MFGKSVGKPGKHRRAVFLILALWISIILGMMAISVAYELRVNMRLTRLSMDRQRAYALARIGVAKAVADLRNDRLMGIADPTEWTGDTLQDAWALAEDKTDVEVGGRDSKDSYTVSVIDEERKLNVAFLNPQNSAVLAKLIETLGDIEAIEAKQIALMIVDYQDPDILPVAGQGAEEAEFWTEWGIENFAETIPPGWAFQPKNDFMNNAEELLLIPGITRELLYGDPAEAGKESRRKRRRKDEEEESLRLIDYITFRSSGYVNINTASETLLEAIIGAAMGDSPAAGGMAKQIMDYRENQGDKKSTVILSADQVLQQAGIPPNEAGIIRQMAAMGTASSYFTIDSVGKSRGVTKRIRYVARLDVDPFPTGPDKDKDEGKRDPEARGSLSNRASHIIDPAVRVVDVFDY